MKQPPGKKPDKPRGQKLPDAEEVSAIADYAQYGEDANNPLLWQLLDLKTRLEANGNPDQAIILALMSKMRESLGKGDPQWQSEAFTAAVEQAVLTRDGDFFREVARMLETRIGAPYRRVDLEVSRAFLTLHSHAESEGRGLPTKREVREAALFSIALRDFEGRQNPPLSDEQMYDYDEEGVPQLKQEIARVVHREIERLPEQNWTRIFKRCGLAHLAEDSGGRKRGKS
jgi:hypothetical protein